MNRKVLPLGEGIVAGFANFQLSALSGLLANSSLATNVKSRNEKGLDFALAKP